MSLRSFYLALFLVFCLHEFAIALPPVNIRKLYEYNEERVKKDELGFPQADEDVLELEQLKLKNLENKVSTTPNTNLDTNADVLSAPTILHKQQPTSKSPIVLGQPEEEEQMVVQYRPHHPIVNNPEVPRQDEAVTNTENIPTKPFYGAARLTYGQNPHLDVKTTSTVSTLSTTVMSEGENITSNTIQPSSTPAATTETSANSETNPINAEEKNNEQEEETVSAELEATKNGERRSLNLKNPKIAESVLRHPDGQYSSFDMAQYVFWTGDETGVAKAVEEFIQEGLMSRENAIKFLRDIRLGIEYLQDSYANRVLPNHLPVVSLHPKVAYTSAPSLPPTTTTTTTIPNPESRPLSPSMRKALEGIPSLLRLQELNNDRNKENSLDYDEMTGRMRLADFLYAEYSLEEVIYQLAKVMFSQSLTNGSEQAQNALQRLTGFLEAEGEHGRISPALQKKILDVILNALSDVLGEHPELLSATRIGLGNSFHKLPRHLVDSMKD